MLFTYNEIIVIILVLILFCIWINKYINNIVKESFDQDQNSAAYTIKYNNDIYDDFYTSMYDTLYIPSNNISILSNVLKKYKQTKKDNFIIVSNTGNLASYLQKIYNNVYVINESLAVIDNMKKKFNNLNNFVVQNNITSSSCFNTNSISCLYFTENNIYRYDTHNRQVIFQNIVKWLLPSGVLLIHLIVPEEFDTVIPAAKKYFDIQQYSKEKILESEIKLKEFNYYNKYEFENEKVTITERFVNKISKNVREYKQELYINSIKKILTELETYGFIVKERIVIQNNKKYIYVFQKN